MDVFFRILYEIGRFDAKIFKTTVHISTIRSFNSASIKNRNAHLYKKLQSSARYTFYRRSHSDNAAREKPAKTAEFETDTFTNKINYAYTNRVSFRDFRQIHHREPLNTFARSTPCIIHSTLANGPDNENVSINIYQKAAFSPGR